MIYDRLHTREIARYGGLIDNMPNYALLFMLFTMASVGLPGTSGFVGEFLSLVGHLSGRRAGRRSSRTTGIILGAGYMLYLYWRICFGDARNADAAAMPDLNMREWWLLAPIALGGAVDGRLSGKLPARRCAPMSAAARSASSAPRRRVTPADGGQAAAAAHDARGGALMNHFARHPARDRS